MRQHPQPGLFSQQPAAKPSPKWERTGPNCGGIWRNAAFPRVVVQHCGHPTANWPYYLNIDGEEPIVSANGRGFANVKAAQVAAELFTAGVIKITAHDDEPRRACLNITALGMVL